jgi:hypothetical protein
VRILALALVALIASGQEREVIPERPISELLASTKAGEMAWGAVLAGRNRLPQYIPQIVELLRHPDVRVRAAALDGLIRLGARVPVTALEPLLSEQFDAVMILAANHLDTIGPFLMKLVSAPRKNDEWMVITSLLAMNPPPGFGALLLRNWQFRLRVEILDDSHIRMPKDNQTGGFCGDDFSPIVSGFPQVGHYYIEDVVGSTPRFPGPHPLSYTINGKCSLGIEPRELELKLLLALSGEPSAPAGVILIATLRDFVGRLRAGLMRNGFLTESDIEASKTAIAARDERPDKAKPLPALDWIF